MIYDKKTKSKRVMITVWGSSVHSAWEVSDALRALKVTHTVDPQDKTSKVRRINMKRPQPKLVHVTSSLKGLRPNSVNFIVGSHSMLMQTNIPSLRGGIELDDAIRWALTTEHQVSVQSHAMSVVDFINHVAKPSLLNKIETEIHRIQPYALRKEVRALMLDFFNSRASDRAVSLFLSKSLRFEHLKSIILSGTDLKAAVARKKLGEDAELIAAETGVPAFDIMYLFNAGNPKIKPTTVKPDNQRQRPK